MNLIRKKHISRRTVLRGVGATVALPFLDAMVPAGVALAQTAAAPKPRLGYFYLPHGAIMERWTPTGEGTDFAMSDILEPLSPFRDYLTVISNLDNASAVSSAVHAITPGTWLSCAPPRRSHAPLVATTVDQIFARQIGQDTKQPSIEGAVEPRGGDSACDGTYGCSVGNTISFRDPTTPLPMEHNSRKFFSRLFGRGATEAEREKIAEDFRSLLDMVAGEAGNLRRDLGAADRVVLDNYLESVREIERRVNLAEAEDLTQYDLPELPAGVPNIDEHLRLMLDMMVVAYQANITRVASLMMAAEVSNTAYTHLGISEAFHPLSHHAGNPVSIDRLAVIQRYHSEVFANFLEKLSQIQDGENTILENAMFLYGGNMSNSNAHDHYPLPTLVVGKGAGRIKGGQHLVYPDRTPLANLHLTMLQRAGIEMDSFGDSTGAFAEL
jgi:hypothetical protein